MERPRIKRTKELVTSGGDVYVLRPTEESDLRIEQPDAVARGLLAALDGTRTEAELEREFGAERVGEALAVLADAELLDDAADDARVPARTLARHDRQLRYFSEVGAAAIAPSEYQRRLREARVVMLGVGGLGSWASYALVCCGVGELVLVDHDRVEESNFNRQILYRERDIGRVKVEAAAEALARVRLGVPRWWRSSARSRASADARARDRGGGLRREQRGLAGPRHRALGERRLLRRRRAVHHAEPLAAGRPRRPDVRAGRDGLLRVPGGDLPRARTRCTTSWSSSAAGEAVAGGDARAGVRVRGRPGGARGRAPPDGPGRARPRSARSYVYDLRTMAVTHEDVPVVAGCPVCGGAAAS